MKMPVIFCLHPVYFNTCFLNETQTLLNTLGPKLLQKYLNKLYLYLFAVLIEIVYNDRFLFATN